MRTRTRAFTLIEMLIVVAIISVLAGLIMTAIGAASKQSKINLVRGRLVLLKTALASYENDFGDYPPSDGDDGLKGAANLYSALMTNQKNGPYVKLSDIKTMNYNGDTVFVDEWKKPIYYIHHRFYHNEAPNKHEYRLISPGPDGVYEAGEKNSDDIVNWDILKPEAE